MLIEFLSMINDLMYLVEWLFIAFGLYSECVYICCNLIYKCQEAERD